MKPLPHGYTNDTRTDGAVVVKRYHGPSADRRRSTERLALSRLAGGPVPVPELIDAPPGALRMRHVAGVHGQDLIAAGHAVQVLRSCGATLRRLQEIEPGVLAHGDYGPNNMLFDPVTHVTTAVVDWEWAHDGDPVEDLAWCEWIIRMHHPEVAGHLPELFGAYGECPSWTRRRDAMLARCDEFRTMVRPAGGAAAGAQRWRRNIEITRQWQESPDAR